MSGWAAIYGPEAEDVADVVDVPRLSTGGGALCRMPVDALADRAIPRMRVETLPHAS